MVPVFEDEKEAEFPEVKEFLNDNEKFGKPLESQLLYTSENKILLVGVGKREKFNFEVCQNWAGSATKYLIHKAKDVILNLPETENLSTEQAIYAAALGVEIAAYDPSASYQSENQPIKLTNVGLKVEKSLSGYQKFLEKAVVVSESINTARRLGDMPANEMTPNYFLNIVRDFAKKYKLILTVIDEVKAKKMGMGAFVGVAQGSDEPSYVLALEYKGDPKSKEKWGLIGKGITFDSGGISIKPGSGMHEMKYDMMGAAAVLAAVQAAAKLKLKVNVAGVMALTENMPSGKAQKPGDIVKTYSGKTVEILNTDAEGRMILADALTYAQKDLQATKLIDLATLTGAMVIALGDFVTGILDNNPKFASEIVAAGKSVGEKFWELPMDENYNEMIKSDIADYTNIGHGGSMPGAAGAITAAKLLESVIENGCPWVHMDIAGTASDLKPKPFRAPGASGVGIKTLVELISSNF